MTIDTILNNASSIMTAVSLITFVGILWWVYAIKGSGDFETISRLPLIDDGEDKPVPAGEKHHG
jgi:cytochrome c oxidase cbb3-type subunit 4